MSGHIHILVTPRITVINSTAWRTTFQAMMEEWTKLSEHSQFDGPVSLEYIPLDISGQVKKWWRPTSVGSNGLLRMNLERQSKAVAEPMD